MSNRSLPTISQYVWGLLRDSPSKAITVEEIANRFCITRRCVVGNMPTVMATDPRVSRVSRGVYRFTPGPPPDPDPEVLYRERGGGVVPFPTGNQVETISEFLESHPGVIWSVADISERTGIKRKSVACQMRGVMEFSPRIKRVSRGMYAFRVTV